jgi:hypothetical protein
VLRTLDVHGLEVGKVLTRPTEERGAVDRGISAGGGAADILGIGDVAAHDLDPQGDERLDVG